MPELLGFLSSQGAILVVSYALGCVVTGYYLMRLTVGQDLRQLGSGSVGARNAARQLGRPAGLFVFALDSGKGAAAVAVAWWLSDFPAAAALAAVAVVAGHIWPVQLGFRGGKGVATALGAILVWHAWLIPIAFVLAVLSFWGTRSTRLSAIAIFVPLPVALAVTGAPPADTVALIVVAIFIIVRHVDNWRDRFSWKAKRLHREAEQ
jgi:glycerol-3-phosphate acyltransferase PlsY